MTLNSLARQAQTTDGSFWYIPEEMSIDDVAALARIYSWGLQLDNTPGRKAWTSSGWTAERKDGGILIKREEWPKE